MFHLRSARPALAWLLFLFLASGQQLQAQQNGFSPPFYFSAPRSAWADDPALAPGQAGNLEAVIIEAGAEGAPDLPAGLRYIVVPDTANTRDSLSAALAGANLLADGDVALTFRPDWADTMAYPHIQMGVSHAAVIRTDNVTAYNIDMPLGPDYNNQQFDSQLNSRHYRDTTAIHILRPRRYGETERQQFRQLATDFVRQGQTIRQRNLLPFNGDYLTPLFTNLEITPQESVARFSAIIRSPDSQRAPMKMYCSEFVWHFLSANAAETGATMFSPMPFIPARGGMGMALGPLSVLTSGDNASGVERRRGKSSRIFINSEAPQLSAGHRQVAREVAPLMRKLEVYYDAVIGGDTAVTIEGRSLQVTELGQMLNSEIAPNYSPTTFLLNSFLPPAHPERVFDYLYTIYFAQAPRFEEAWSIGREQSSTRP